MRLIAPALRRVQGKRIYFLQPPQVPQGLGLVSMGLSPDNIIWVKSKTTADGQWAAEHILRSGCAGALL